jgi:type I restriction enzyme, S subunit
MKFDLPFELLPGWELKTVENLIAEEVIERPLDGNHGGVHPKSSDYVVKGVPFIMASDLEAGQVNLDTCKFISEEQASSLRKGFSKTGDVLLSHKATIGRTAILQESAHDYVVLTPQLTYYRVKDQSALNNVYLKSYFDSAFFQNTLQQWAGAGSTRAYLGITGQLKLPIIVPPIEVQLSIANHINFLSKKIELNQRMNNTLEKVVQAIFKCWFVDFEPTLAKMAGESEEGICKRLTITTEILDLFPNLLDETALDTIPEGWGVETVGGFLELAYGKALTKTDRIHGEVPVYGSGGINGYHNRALENGPGIIVGRKGTVGSLYWEGGAFFPIDTVFYVRTNRSLHHVFYHLKTLGLESMNTDAAVPGLNRNNVYRMEVPRYPHELVDAFDRVATDIRQQLSHNQAQNNTLSSLKDTLLSKLISGELSAENIEGLAVDV